MLWPGDRLWALSWNSHRAQVICVPSVRDHSAALPAVSENGCFIYFIAFLVIQDGRVNPAPDTPSLKEAGVCGLSLRSSFIAETY